MSDKENELIEAAQLSLLEAHQDYEYLMDDSAGGSVDLDELASVNARITCGRFTWDLNNQTPLNSLEPETVHDLVNRIPELVASVVAMNGRLEFDIHRSGYHFDEVKTIGQLRALIFALGGKFE